MEYEVERVGKLQDFFSFLFPFIPPSRPDWTPDEIRYFKMIGIIITVFLLLILFFIVWQVFQPISLAKAIKSVKKSVK